MSKTALCERNVLYALFQVVSSDRPDPGDFRLTAQTLRIMRMLTFFLFIASLAVTARPSAQTITLSGKDLSIEKVFTAIERQTGFLLLANRDLLASSKPVSLAVSNMPLLQFLDLLLADQALTYKMKDKTIVLYERLLLRNFELPVELVSRAPLLIGRVRAADGTPLEGITFSKNKAVLGISGGEGSFSLAVSVGDIISVSAVGYLGLKFRIVSAVSQVASSDRSASNNTPAFRAVLIASNQPNAAEDDEKAASSKKRSKLKNSDTSSLAGVDVVSDYEIIPKESATGSFVQNTDNGLLITLLPNISALTGVEVVSTGYQFIPKDRATGAFAIISTKELENRTSRDLNVLMEGLTPGFVVQYQGNGLVNEDPQIMMRGVSTFGSTQPLIVVDGFPIEGGINSINPNDVARITFLRDAAAAAIWGVKASNGVIVIDTKRGSTVTPKVTFRSNLTMMEKPSLSYLNRLGSADLVDLETQMFNAGNAKRSDYAGPLGAYSQVVGVLFDHKDGLIDDAARDRQLASLASHNNSEEAGKAFFANNYVQDNTISFSGAPSAFMNYYGSVGYTNGTGLYKGDGRKHTNANFNTELKVTGNLKLNVGFNYSAMNTDRSPLKSGNLGVDIPYVLTLLPYERFYQTDGAPARIARKYSPEFNTTMMNMGYYDAGYYPANDWKYYDFNTKDNNLRFQSTLAYKINKTFTFQGGFKSETGFSLRSDLSREQGYASRSLLNRFAAQNQVGKLIFNLPKGDWLQEGNGRNSNYYVRGQLDMDHAFKKHPGRINALVGTEWQRTQSSSTTDTRFGYGASSGLSFPVDQNMLLNFFNPALTESMRFEYSSYYNKAISDDRYVSYYFNGAYEYDAKYSFSASARINKSSRFDASAGLNKEVLGSLGLKWTISEERFMQYVNWVDKLAMRFTTGMTGNVPGFTYSPYHTSAFNSLSTLTNTFTLQVLNQPNKHLKWESSLTNNLGFDFSFLKGKIAGMLDLYHKKTNDLLGVQMIDPSLVGRFLVQQNIADMTNKGIELQLNTVNFKTRDWVWRTNVNASYNKNTVNKVTGNYGALVQRVAQVESYPANSLWAYRWAGLSNTGVPQYFDIQNGKDVIVTSTGSLSINDLKHIGSITPVYSVGLMNAFGYKGWELSFLFMSTGGHYLQTDSYSESIYTSDLSTRDIVFMAPVAALKDRWKEPGDEAKTHIPAYGQSFGYNYTDIKYQSASWIKLREVVLSYQFTKKQYVKLPVQDLKVSLQGRNLWRWVANDAGIDPEAYRLHQGYRTLPIVASYSFNVQVNF